MRKWLPYVVAGLAGVLVAALLFGPGMSEPEREKPAAKAARAPKAERAARRTTWPTSS